MSAQLKPVRRRQTAAMESDGQLVQRVRAGDGEAYSELVRRHQRAAFALAWSLVSDGAEAEDLTQEAFLRGLRNLDMLADPERFGAWLRRITFGTCIDWLRTFRPQLFRSETEPAGGADQPTTQPSPLERIERLELQRRVLRAVAALPPHYRTPLTLFHLEGLSHERVAAALGVTVSSARSLVTRARQRLAPLLEEHVPDVKERMASDDMFAEQSTLRWLHVTNGDSAAGTLRRSGLPGDVTVWADALHDGPVRPDSGTEAWRRARARFVEQAGWLTEEEAMRMTTAWDAALDAFRNYDEVVLWFEHDLFDQLLLVRHLEWFGRQTPPPVRLSLICIGAYPGIEPFHGLGQLSPDQFASLIDTRQRVTARQLELGRSTWLAFTAAEPTALERILAADTSSLPFLAGALQRLIEEYPSAGNGLSRSERQIVEALADGPRTLDAVFVACARMEERVFMGDTAFLTRLEQLATVPHPLLHIERRPAAQPFPDGTATLTATGQRVRAGEDDMIRLNGIDRWVGGVHLHQGEGGVLWRRDDDSGRLVRASPGRSVS